MKAMQVFIFISHFSFAASFLWMFSRSRTGQLEAQTCRNCKKQFDNSNSNSSTICSFHPGIYSGRLNRVNDIDTSGLEYFWSCCGQDSVHAEGCIKNTKHVSYDEENYQRYSTLTGKPINYKKLS